MLFFFNIIIKKYIYKCVVNFDIQEKIATKKDWLSFLLFTNLSYPFCYTPSDSIS